MQMDRVWHQIRPARGRKSLTKIQPPAHFRYVAQWLCRFPSEILLYYPTLEDIPLRTVLLLTGSLPDSGKLDHCITGRKEYELVFPSIEQLTNIRNTYLFLYELRVIRGFPPRSEYSSPLACTAGELATWKPPNLRALQIYLAQAIQRILTDEEIIYHECLKHSGRRRRLDLRDYLKMHYLQDWDTPTTDQVTFSNSRLNEAPEGARNQTPPSYFQHMEESTVLVRHKQLVAMANLIRKYPEILKRAYDPHPEPRPNSKHTVNYLKGLASEFDKDIRKRYKWTPYVKANVCPSFFRSDIFPLVPSDKSLALFVTGVINLLPVLPRWLAEIVSPSVDGDLTQHLPQTSSSVRLFATPFAKVCLRVDESLYPYNILKDIKTAVEGMALVHILPGEHIEYKPRVLRTRWTPWSADPYRQSLDRNASQLEQKPVFLSPPLPHLDVLPPGKLDKQCIRFYMPTVHELHSLKEFEWLEAFCRTIRFLEKMEHGGNPGYERALEQQRQIDLRIRENRDRRRSQKSESEDLVDANRPVGGPT